MRCATATQALLHVDDAEPPSELEPDPTHPADLHEAEAAVERDGRLRAPVADDGDDLADSRILAGGDQRLQERAPEALAGGRLAEVDGVLDGEAVSRLGRPRLGERVPEDLPRGRLGHQARQPGPGEPGELVAPEG